MSAYGTNLKAKRNGNDSDECKIIETRIIINNFKLWFVILIWNFLFLLLTDVFLLFVSFCFSISYSYCFRDALFYLIVFVLGFFALVSRDVLFNLLVYVSAFLCCLTKKRWQRKQKNFLRESFTKERSLSIPDYHRPQA